MARRKTQNKFFKEQAVRIYSLILLLVLLCGFFPYLSSSLVGNIVKAFFFYLFGNYFLFVLLLTFYFLLLQVLKNEREDLFTKNKIAVILISVGILILMSKTFRDNPNFWLTLKGEQKELETVMSGLLKNKFITYEGSGIVGTFLCLIFTLGFTAKGASIFGWIFIGVGALFLTGFKIFDIIQRGVYKRNVVQKEEQEEFEKVKREPLFKKMSQALFEPVENDESRKEEIKEIPKDKQEEEKIVKDYNEFNKLAEDFLNSTERKEKIEKEEAQMEMTRELYRRNYVLPPIELISGSKKIKKQEANKKEIAMLENILREFEIDSKVTGYHIGPSVTQYELEVGKGIKLSRINSLNKEIALGLSKKEVRIQAPIPGLDRVGIEIANDKISAVNFKEVLEMEPEESKKNLLSVALGIDIMGNACFCDLSKAPHLLVAGATGSGKSVCINTIIMSILMKATPDEVKLFLIDPKKVELGNYNGIEHLGQPVVTDPKKASELLEYLKDQMEKRFAIFEKAKVKKISEYNEKQLKKGEKPLPYYVCIIDELADLMIVAGKEVESYIMRITQLARAAGIHLIVATQRPSTDIITGVVKSNIPSRISFAVSSSIDSRTILDQGGAEKLLGKGDMLFKPQDKNIPIRIQGVFIPDEDINRVINFVKKQSSDEIVDIVEENRKRKKEEEQAKEKALEEKEVLEQELKDQKELAEKAKDPSEDLDNLYPLVRDFVVENQKCSISYIQRRFSIGYQRAARIVDSLEANGVVSAQDGSKPRKVLAKE